MLLAHQWLAFPLCSVGTITHERLVSSLPWSPGVVYADNVVDFERAPDSRDSTPRGNLETIAAQVSPPRASQNFLAPVNDVSH